MKYFYEKLLLINLDLLGAWVLRTIRARYKQSVLGGLWAVIQPAAIVAIFSVIFTLFIPLETGDIPYVIFSYTAMVPWVFLSTSISDMVESIVINMNLVSKIYFPREILPISALLARLLDFGIAFIVLLLLMLYYRKLLITPSWLYLPIIFFTQVSLIAGIGLLGAALNVFYRDIRHIFNLGLQIWFYASPIVYPVSVVPEQYRFLYHLNPMTGIIESYRATILYQKHPDHSLLLSLLISFLCLLFGYYLFKRVEFQFADII